MSLRDRSAPISQADQRKRELAAARQVRKMDDPRDVTVALWLDAWRVIFPGGRSAPRRPST